MSLATEIDSTSNYISNTKQIVYFNIMAIFVFLGYKLTNEKDINIVVCLQ